MAETPDTDVAILLEQALRAHRQSGEHVRVPDATVATAIAEITRLRCALEAAREALAESARCLSGCQRGTVGFGVRRQVQTAIRSCSYLPPVETPRGADE